MRRAREEGTCGGQDIACCAGWEKVYNAVHSEDWLRNCRKLQ